MGGIPAKAAYEKAQACFAGIAFSSLSLDDLLRKDLASRDAHHAHLRARTHACKLGEVDAFLSRSTRCKQWPLLPRSALQRQYAGDLGVARGELPREPRVPAWTASCALGGALLIWTAEDSAPAV